MNDQAILKFRRLGVFTIFAVYLVLLAGGVVRASGAGMGCPDWPTCFGQWIPPTDEAQLPSDYHQIYAQRGYENTQFNPVKTWTEYTNRLIGATTGFLVLLTTWASRIFLQRDKPIFFLSLTNLFLIGLNAARQRHSCRIQNQKTLDARRGTSAQNISHSMFQVGHKM